MGRRIYPISSLQTLPKTRPPPLRLNLVTTYTGAVSRGSPFLCLPRSLRDRIYSLSLTSQSVPQLTSIEIPGKAGPIALPNLCEVDHISRHEVTELIIKTTTFIIPNDAAVYNFFAWLEDVLQGSNKGRAYGLVRRIEILGLEIFERSEAGFAATGTRLVQRLPFVRGVTVMIDLRHLRFVDEEVGEGKAFDFNDFTARYDLIGLTKMPLLEKIVFTLKPFMALEKSINKLVPDENWMEKGYKLKHLGLYGFWGLKEWIEKRVAVERREIEVVCPRLEDIVRQ